MIKGRVKDDFGYHPRYGLLKKGRIVDLPDNFNFKLSELFEPVKQVKKKITKDMKSYYDKSI